jgi:hypothetical protein
MTEIEVQTIWLTIVYNTNKVLANINLSFLYIYETHCKCIEVYLST